MRSVIYGVGISLDGHIARPDGSVDFLFMPKDYSMGPFFGRIDIAVMGRKTYEIGLKLGGGTISSPGMKCYVFSRSLPSDAPGGVTVVREAPKPFIEMLRRKAGKDIWLMGGGELARAFFQEDLVDELYLGVVPVVIGAGIPAFPSGFPERKFVLIENKTFSRGMIALLYKRSRTTRKNKRP